MTPLTPRLDQLRQLEVELHHPGARSDRERLERLLHPDFKEVGRSGRAYTRETVVRYLSEADVHPGVLSDGFAVAELGPDVALLTYRSAQVPSGGGLFNHTLRSSVWVRNDAGWRLRYHQGTPAAEVW
jgi:hypothetical protein